MVEAIIQEILQRPVPENVLPQNEPVETIYFGGGTPSLLTEKELTDILAAVYTSFKVADGAEITLETNPDDHSGEKLETWKDAGINRLSIGVQSFFEADLVWMNRAHNAQQSMHCIKAAQDKGFNNLTIDLIYGLPGLSNEGWKQNFDTAVNLGIPHLSCYALTVEPKTALDLFIKKGQLQKVDSEQQANHFTLLMDWASTAGFEHYEISNFALPGHRSRHNTAYWQGKPYFGFGPSAHSFDGHKTRWWNIANNGLYVQGMQLQQPNIEFEILTPEQQLNEYIMTGLRTTEGIDKNGLLSISDSHFTNIKKSAAKWEKQGKLIVSETTIRLTNAGRLFADGIAGDLFV